LRLNYKIGGHFFGLTSRKGRGKKNAFGDLVWEGKVSNTRRKGEGDVSFSKLVLEGRWGGENYWKTGRRKDSRVAVVRRGSP